MMRGFLIALLVVPTLAVAAPRKKRPPPAPKPEPAKPEPAPEPTPAPVPAAEPAKPAPPPSPAAQPAAPATPAVGTTSGTGASAPAEPADVDVDSLRQEYLALRDELFKSRARANAVASQLYSTRVTIRFTWASARHYGVSKASIRLDGATVYEDTTGAIAGDDGVRFTGFVAPGRHLVTFHVEAAGKDDDAFTSATETQVVVLAVPNKELVIAAKGRDSGDIAYAWKRSERGSYGIGIDVAVKAQAAGAKK
jgi:hypothetical protein